MEVVSTVVKLWPGEACKDGSVSPPLGSQYHQDKDLRSGKNIRGKDQSIEIGS